jgi:hypothetical protein
MKTVSPVLTGEEKNGPACVHLIAPEAGSSASKDPSWKKTVDRVIAGAAKTFEAIGVAHNCDPETASNA